MRKRQISKILKESFKVTQMFFSECDFKVDNGNDTFHVKVINVLSTHQVTVNSQDIWEIKKGRIKGIRFEAISSDIVNLSEFNKLDNKIIFLANKPFKLLKVLNESELLDISGKNEFDNMFVSSDILKIIEFIKEKI